MGRVTRPLLTLLDHARAQVRVQPHTPGPIRVAGRSPLSANRTIHSGRHFVCSRKMHSSCCTTDFSQPCIIRFLCCTPAPPLYCILPLGRSSTCLTWPSRAGPKGRPQHCLRRPAQPAARSPPATRPGPPHRARPGLPRPATAPAGPGPPRHRTTP
jgi:hypothetical protein